MRRALAFSLIITVILLSPALTTGPTEVAPGILAAPVAPREMGGRLLSSAGGSGTPSSATAIMTRSISGLQMGIYNTYEDLTNSYLLDLSAHLVTGWTLTQVVLEASSMIAAPERASLNVVKNTNIEILNNSGIVTDGLYQSFYGLPFDGRLENYSITYFAPQYDTAFMGYAYLVVRDDPSSTQNVTGWVSPFVYSLVDRVATHDCSSDNAILNASTTYYAVVDGTAMRPYYAAPTWYFNEIYWRAQNTVGSETGYHFYEDDWYEYQPINPREADLNYTYTPWNKTSGSPLAYTAAEDVGLQGNASALSDDAWVFSDSSNITLIEFSSSTAVDIQYELKLTYTKSVPSTTQWEVPTSGSLVEWNVTTTVDYPVVPDLDTKSLNVTVQSDWTATGLYNDTYPGTTYNHYSRSGDVVTCTNMDDETWTLSLDAPNHVTFIDVTDSSSGLPVEGKVANTIDLDVDVSVEDGLSNPVTGGTTNFTVLKTGSSIYSPAEIPASSGLASFFWDISASTTGNGTHSLEVFWANGTEAGYLVVDLFIYYSTSLIPSEPQISAFAEDSFYFGVDFNRLYPATGLDTSLGASVTYTFGSTINASLTDQSAGMWDTTISTAGFTSGTFNLYVYAEGYALENRSLRISVNLVYETLPLSEVWSNTNNISSQSSTNLTIVYETSGGAVPDATVNVTFQGSTYPLRWDPIAESYWIQINGTDFSGVPGTFLLNVSAWKDGYQARFDDTIQLEVTAETGYVFDTVFIPSRSNLTYIDSLEIRVTYEFDGEPINASTVVRAIFNGSAPVFLEFNASSGLWEATLQCSSYLGSWEITVQVSADGYLPDQWTPYLLFVGEDPATLSASWVGLEAATSYSTPVTLDVTLQDSLGNPIDGANVTVTVYGALTSMSFVADGVYTLIIDPQDTAGVFLVSVELYETGYLAEEIVLNLTVRATTTLDVNHYSTEYEQWNLTIAATYEDSVWGTPIADGNVTVTINGVTYNLTYSAGVYTVEIVLDLPPDMYTIHCSASEEFAVAAQSDTLLTVLSKDRLDLVIAFGGNLVAGQLIEIRATLTSNQTGLPIAGVEILFTVSVQFANGTVVQIVEGSMSDTTNSQGVATIGINVPDGQVERLDVEAIYEGHRTRWPAYASTSTGVQVNVLSLLIAFFTSDVGLMMIGSIFLLAVVAAGYNRTVKPRKKAAKRSLESQLQKFRDLQTIQHFMAVYLDRGTCVFYHPFKDERIEPDLISGFISAITSVYGEIKGDGVRGTLEEIQYHGLRLNSYSGQYIIGILILEGEMTSLLRERLQFFIELFENQYEQELDKWNGVIDCFDPEWVVSTLNSAFNYTWHLPHRFGPTQKVSKTDAKILDYIAAVRDERSEFYLKDLIKPLSEVLGQSDAATLDKLLSLQERGAIVPVGVQTILQRQGMGLADGEDVTPIVGVELLRAIEEREASEQVETQKPADTEHEEEKEAEVEPVEEEPSPEEPETDPLESFVEDVEGLLQDEPVEEEKPEDDLEKFVMDVESLLSEEEEED